MGTSYFDCTYHQYISNKKLHMIKNGAHTFGVASGLTWKAKHFAPGSSSGHTSCLGFQIRLIVSGRIKISQFNNDLNVDLLTVFLNHFYKLKESSTYASVRFHEAYPTTSQLRESYAAYLIVHTTLSITYASPGGPPLQRRCLRGILLYPRDSAFFSRR